MTRSTRQLARSDRRDMRVIVRRVESENVDAELESRDRRARKFELRALQLAFVSSLCKPMELLPGKRLAR
jgi:hypothetical protein